MSVRVTIADVASEAGVSITTVSRFINGSYGNMSAEVRERLQSVVDRLGYVPSSAARSLKSGKSRLVGVILSNIAHPYWSTVLSGVEEGFRDLGYGVIISSAGDNAALEDHYLDIFVRQAVDGVLLNPSSANRQIVERWSALRRPIVTLDRTLPGLPFDLVATDNVYGTRLAASHLIGLGHKHIALMSWHTRGLSNREERLQGYLQAMDEAGVEVNPDHIRYVDEGPGAATRETSALFGQKRRPTAVIATSGLLNLEVLAGLKRAGLRVPDDVSLVGYDQSPWDALLEPPMTTVATPAHRLGLEAARHLVRRIEDTESKQRKEIRLKPELVIRASTRRV